MMPGGGLITFAIMLLALPFAAVVALLLDLLQIARLLSWVRQLRRAVSLPQRNMARATGGAFVLVLCVFAAANGFPVSGWKVIAGIGALAAHVVAPQHAEQVAQARKATCGRVPQRP